jgi:phage/plasmid-associated DNA primase
MNQATDGNRNKKDILIAFIAASLRGMASLHKFLMLTGPGGTGKGGVAELMYDIAIESKVDEKQ